MIIAATCVLAIVVIAFVLGVRPKDLPAPEPESPFRHLDERKAAIYDNLRDLQFEYRLGKLSDHDYQTTKKDLQRDLAGVLAEIDRLKAELAAGRPQPAPGVAPAKAAAAAPAASKPAGSLCPHCGARFDRALKFCGECGKPMQNQPAAAQPAPPSNSARLTSLRQSLLVKVMYDEAQLNRLIDREREELKRSGAPDEPMEDLIARANERWERDNRD
jgi:hypothetical protein